MEQEQYLEAYEQRLEQSLRQLLTGQSLLPAQGPLPSTPDLTDLWPSLEESYVADAIQEIAKYPTVALGWSMYLGMGLAKYWDDDWTIYSKLPNLYLHLRDKRGFDYMDEVVRFDLLDWDCEETVRSCAQMALDQIRHEQIEPSSPLAYHVYLRSVKVLYLMGAAAGLFHLGYRMERQ